MPEAGMKLLTPDGKSPRVLSPASKITQEDPRWRKGPAACPSTIVEIVSQSYDTGRGAVGSSPYRGDMGNLGVQVPATASTGPEFRYQIMLAGIEVPDGGGLILRGLRQYATLRAEVEVGSENLYTRVYELPIVTPGWSFQDGNISWHVHWRPAQMNRHRSRTSADGSLPGMVPTLDTISAGLVYNQLGPYVPEAAGRPPGNAVQHLGTFYDLRWPWHTQPDSHLAIPMHGPGVLIFMASVLQTDIETRAPTPACTNMSCLTPEDQFLSSYSDARYGRVAGAMTVELFPEGLELR